MPDPQTAPDVVMDIPGVGNVAFPASMSPDDRNAAAAKLYQEKQGAFGVTVGSERTRGDANVLGVNHDAIVRSMADMAAKYLPASVAPAAAMIGTAAADVPLSLLEAFSSPEGIATMGAGAMGGLKSVPKAGGYTAPSTPIRDAMVTIGNELQTAPGAGMNAKLGGRALSTLGSLKRTIAERSVDPFALNRSGYIPGQAASDLHADTSQFVSSLDRYLANSPSLNPDAGIPQGPLAQPSLDRLMPNRGGVPDAGVPQGPLVPPSQWSIDHVMPNRSSVPTTAPGAEPRLTEQQLVQLMREHDAAVAGTAVPKAKPIPAAATTAAAVPPPLPKFTVQDVKAIKDLIAKGATQDEAVTAVVTLRGYPKAWQSFAISHVLRPSK